MVNNSSTVFIIWNVFQYIHFKPILEKIPKSTLVVIRKRNKTIIKENVIDTSVSVVFVDEEEVFEAIASFAKVIIVQTIFNEIYQFSQQKIIMLQYGYAKEKHNFGQWRALADLNLVYGSIAQQRIAHLSSVRITGSPKFDQWHDNNFHKDCYRKYSLFINTEKPVLLYAPSWGDVSSFSYYIDKLHSLAHRYNILIKIHHNTLLTTEAKSLKKNYPNVTFFDDRTDLLSLLSVSDILLSDYSGAIFDGVFCKKPIVLLDLPLSDKKKCISLIGNHSIELTKRNELGYIVKHPAELQPTINKALNFGEICSIELYEDLFSNINNATEEVVYAITGVLTNNKKSLNLIHKWHRMRVLRRLKVIAKKKNQTFSQ